MIANPWADLPHNPDYVLPDDAPDVRQFNERASEIHRLQIDKLIPEPFIGNPEAPLVLLSNNPGFGKGAECRQAPAFKARMRDNLVHKKCGYPFLYLDPISNDPNMDWWRRKLKHLIKHFGCKVVADSILNAVYFPYSSVKYHRGTPDVPSQTYTFNLVKEAMKREAIIVFMRKGDNWLNAIPELASYKRGFRVLNTQSPCIGPNCPGYHEIVNAIEATQV